ncbi:unnamed protein product [Linum trigynum]|uniref:Uncharacterized protein n=1 Tax=Linum trigynum TaxID=586398 RepID=A0AAV2GRZ6_9ROSI
MDYTTEKLNSIKTILQPIYTLRLIHFSLNNHPLNDRIRDTSGNGTGKQAFVLENASVSLKPKVPASGVEQAKAKPSINGVGK